jgi:hypothetical protein
MLSQNNAACGGLTVATKVPDIPEGVSTFAYLPMVFF